MIKTRSKRVSMHEGKNIFTSPLHKDQIIPASTTQEMEPGTVNEGEVKAQLVRDLHDRSRFSLLIMLVLALVFCWSMAAAYKTDERARFVFIMWVSVILVRWVIVMIPLSRRDALLSVRAQHFIFNAGVLLTSLPMAALIVLAWPLLDTAHVAILTVLTGGMISGAMMSLGFRPLTFMFYYVPPVAALFTMAVTDVRPAWGADILAVSFVLYAATVVAMSVDQARIRRRNITLGLELSNMVLHDSLTKLHNRRFLQEYMIGEDARLSRDAYDSENGRQIERDAFVGVYMIDLDNFKDVNDTYGHAVGDLVLKQMADALSGSSRKSDVLIRWGGEEFVLIARIKRCEDARIVAENQRHKIETTDFRLPFGTSLNKTCSVGFCVLPFFLDKPGKLNWEQAMGLADAALYIAKQEGRNRWVGVICGTKPWDDTQSFYVQIRQDLKQACEQAYINLERSRESA
jgi:diguanylate cyclase (GGDEF)-like protein